MQGRQSHCDKFVNKTDYLARTSHFYTGIKYGDVLYISTKHIADRKREKGERGRTISTDRNRQTKEQSDYIQNVT